MKISYRISIIFLFLTAMACQQPVSDTQTTAESSEISQQTVTNELPGNSIYHFDEVWTDSEEHKIQLVDFKGKPVVISMFFTSCGYACPMLVQDIKNITTQFENQESLPFEIVLISFDNLRDTPERLKLYAEAQGLSAQWHLLHGETEQIREIAVALGISFDLEEDGNIAHSNKKLLLDENGEIVYAIDGLETSAEEFARHIVALI